jgi:hypothetical protein
VEQQPSGAGVLSARALWALAAPGDGAHAHHQFAVVDGLGDVVIGAGGEAREAILDGAGSAQEDDGHIVPALLADDAAGLLARHAGKAEVEEHEVVGSGAEGVEAILCTGDGGDAEALDLQARGYDVGDLRIVLDHQHGERAGDRRLSRDVSPYHRRRTSSRGRAFHTRSVATRGVGLCRGTP